MHREVHRRAQNIKTGLQPPSSWCGAPGTAWAVWRYNKPLNFAQTRPSLTSTCQLYEWFSHPDVNYACMTRIKQFKSTFELHYEKQIQDFPTMYYPYWWTDFNEIEWCIMWAVYSLKRSQLWHLFVLAKQISFKGLTAAWKKVLGLIGTRIKHHLR